MFFSFFSQLLKTKSWPGMVTDCQWSWWIWSSWSSWSSRSWPLSPSSWCCTSPKGLGLLPAGQDWVWEPCRAKRFLLLQDYHEYFDDDEDHDDDVNDGEDDNLPVKAATISLSCLPSQWQIFLANLRTTIFMANLEMLMTNILGKFGRYFWKTYE